MHTKRISAGYTKGRKWAPTPRGPHSKRESIPLITLVKTLGLGDNSKEAREVIAGGMIQVDGKTQTDGNYGVGLMDVVSIPKMKKHFRATAAKGGLTFKEISGEEAKTKLCRVVGKTLLPGGKTQVNLHDGGNIITDKKINVNDTLVVEIPRRNIKDAIPYAAGNQVMIVSGRHCGEKGVIKEVLRGTAARKSLTTIGDFQTLTGYVFAIGRDKAVVDL